MSLLSRIAQGKADPRTGKRIDVRTVRDRHGRLSEQWLVNGTWVEMKG